MKIVSNPRILRTITLVFIMIFPSTFTYSKVIHIDDDGQADFDNIQAGIDAAEYDDTVKVASGIYYENIILRNGINLFGAGTDTTIIDARGYGDVVNVVANDTTICGFTLRNSGESDLGHTNCGVHVSGSYAPVIRNNIIVNNRIGVGVWYGANPDIRNNIIENNSSGLYVYGSKESPSNPSIINNTIVDNEIDGIILRVMVSPVISNNIITGHVTGINHNYVIGSPTLSYNDLWHNNVNYLLDNRTDDSLAGPDSISADPCFAEPGYWVDMNNPNIVTGLNDPNAVWIGGDYHLKSQAGRYNPITQTWVVDDVTSPCIDAGDPNSPVGDEPKPNGGVINMGAYGGTAEASKSLSGLHAKYSGGSGEPNDPYQIATAEDLMLLGGTPEDYDKHFILTDDIDLDPNLPGRKVFDKAVIAPDTDSTSDGFQGLPFTGVFDGNGHIISHLTIIGEAYIGLFGYLGSGGEVRELGMVNVSLRGLSGGCVGGVVGWKYIGTVDQCFSTGEISGIQSIGGLVGANGGSGTVKDSYSAASATGSYNVGGLIGSNDGDVFRCYSVGAVSGASTDVGGLVANPWGTVSKCFQCFWDMQTSGQATSAGGIGKTTAEMQASSIFLEAGWDFMGETANGTEDIWWILEGEDYPRLSWERLGNLKKALPGETIVVYVHSPENGDIAVRVQLPVTPRYPEGAPVVVVASTWFVSKYTPRYVVFDLKYDPTEVGAIFVTYLWPGKEDRETGAASEGTYDYGGPNSIAALRDVILFAAGILPDTRGYYIGELMEMKPLTDNVGLYASSHAGVVATNVLAYHAEDLSCVKYFVGRENPTRDEMYPLEIGYFNDRRNPVFNPYYDPTGFTPTSVSVDYSRLGWIQNEAYPQGMPFFDVPDGNDYILSGNGPDMDGKRYFSMALTRALLDNGVFTLETWPQNLATPDVVDSFWPYRITVNNYPLLKDHLPNLKVMLVFAKDDHVLSARDKPHIHQAYYGFHNTAGLWVRLNADEAYFLQLDKTLSDYPENAANTEPVDWMNAKQWGYPAVYGSRLYSTTGSLAGIAEMADRVQTENWSDDLDCVLYEYAISAGDPQS